MRPLSRLPDPTRPARAAARLAVRRAGSIWDRFADWFNSLQLAENTILLGFATAIGLGAGLGVGWVIVSGSVMEHPLASVTVKV